MRICPSLQPTSLRLPRSTTAKTKLAEIIAGLKVDNSSVVMRQMEVLRRIMEVPPPPFLPPLLLHPRPVPHALSKLSSDGDRVSRLIRDMDARSDPSR